MTPEIAILDAVTAILGQASEVTAIVGDKVLDEVPADRSPVKAPYVYAGPINRQRVPDSSAIAWTMRMRLFAVSTGFGRREAWNITDAVARALNGTELTLADGFEALGPALVIQAGDVIAPPSPKTTFVDIEIFLQEESNA